MNERADEEVRKVEEDWGRAIVGNDAQARRPCLGPGLVRPRHSREWVRTHCHRPSLWTYTSETRSTSRNGCPRYLPPETPRAVTTAVSP
jgi:hypothetical protein